MRRAQAVLASVVVGGIAIGGASLGVTSATADTDIHSDEARAEWCTRAQQFVAGTDLVSINVIHADPTTFVESDATPYDTDEGRDLPLTTHQLVTSVDHPFENRPMESVLSCKLKGGQALQQHYGQESAQLGKFCSDVHADIADRVFAALTPDEEARLVYTRGQVFMDPDVPASGGGDWTSGQPQGGDFTLPQIAYEEADGQLHLRSKALIVPTVGVDIPPFVPRNKQGTHYCHLIAPDHLREIVTGDLRAASGEAAEPDQEAEPDSAPDPSENEPNAAPADTAPVLAETGGGAVVLAGLIGWAAWTIKRRR